jgi:hypothetical protein
VDDRESCDWETESRVNALDLVRRPGWLWHSASGLTTKSVGEIRVNQSGSVALSAEEVRGPPQAQVMDNNDTFDLKIATNQGFVGSNPAGRATIQRLGSQNQVFLFAVGRLWNDLSTGPYRRVAIHVLGAQNQVLPRSCRAPAMSLRRPTRNTVYVPLRLSTRFACFSSRPTSALA